MSEQTPSLDIEDSFNAIVQQNPDIFLKPFGVDQMINIEYDQREATATQEGVTFTYTKNVIDDDTSGDD